MNKLSIRLLRADEIECRIGTISDCHCFCTKTLVQI